jgi:Cys-tRNA(Pro) deacylase
MTLTEQDLQDYIDRHGIEAEIMLLPEPTPTVETAAAALGVDPAQIVKSLLFQVDGTYRLVIAGGIRPVKYKKLARLYDVGRRKVRLVPPAQVETVTGYPVGTVPPFGHPQPIPTVADHTVLAHEEVYAGGGAHNGMLRIRVEELLRVVGGKIARLTAAPDG